MQNWSSVHKTQKYHPSQSARGKHLLSQKKKKQTKPKQPNKEIKKKIVVVFQTFKIYLLHLILAT